MSGSELEEAMETARRNSFSVTLVLPVLEQTTLKPTVNSMVELGRGLEDFEVVANDWGTLAELAHAGVAVSAGRFLFKMKRLPRVGQDTVPAMLETADDDDTAAILARQMKELARFAPDEAWFATLLQRLGVRRVETEMVPQGVSFSETRGVDASLLLPWTYVTGGGDCPVARFATRDGATVCARRCRSTFILPSYPKAAWRLLQLGHTVFFPAHPLLEYYLRTDRYDRYVLEPGPAM